MTAPTKEPPVTADKPKRSKRNPYQDYVVRSQEKAYSGHTAKVEFLNGRGEVHALPRDTCKCDTPKKGNQQIHLDECKVGERIDALDHLLSNGYTVKFARFLVEEEDDGEDDDEE